MTMVNRAELEPWIWCLRLCKSAVDPMHRWLVVARGLRRAPHFSSHAAGGLLELSQLEGHDNQATSFKKWVGMINVDVLPCSGSGGARSGRGSPWIPGSWHSNRVRVLPSLV